MKRGLLILYAFLISLLFSGFGTHVLTLALGYFNREFLVIARTLPALPFWDQVLLWYWSNSWQAYAIDFFAVLFTFASLLYRHIYKEG